MVRSIHAVATPFSPAVPRIDRARIVAWSFALALHVVALLVLLVPATYVAAPLPRQAPQVRWIAKEPALPPVPPPMAVPVQPQNRTPTLRPQPVTLPVPQAQQALPATTATEPELPISTTPAVTEPVLPAATGTASEGVQLHYRSAPPPRYPIDALRDRVQGTVLLRVEVDGQGRPVAVSIERSSGSRSLDQAARQQVLRQWRFVAAQQDGMGVSAVGLVPISFTLPD